MNGGDYESYYERSVNVCVKIERAQENQRGKRDKDLLINIIGDLVD